MKKLLILITLLFSLASAAEAQQAIENKIEIRLEGDSYETQLTWVNKREVNASYYIVEYADQAGKYFTLHCKKANGNGNAGTSYSFPIGMMQHVAPRYYRVTAVLMGGQKLPGQVVIYYPEPANIQHQAIAVNIQ